MIGLCGASGRIGYPLFEYLKSKGNKVLGTYHHHKITGLVRYDLRKDSISFFDKCEYVILAAAYCNTPFCENNRVEAYWLNVWRTKELLQHLSDKKIPTLFISSIAAKVNLADTYGKYKRLVERYIVQEGLAVEYIRPGKTGKDNVGQLCEEIYEGIKLRLRKKDKEPCNQC